MTSNALANSLESNLLLKCFLPWKDSRLAAVVSDLEDDFRFIVTAQDETAFAQAVSQLRANPHWVFDLHKIGEMHLK